MITCIGILSYPGAFPDAKILQIFSSSLTVVGFKVTAVLLLPVRNERKVQFDGMGVQRGKELFEEQPMLSDKLTVLVNDIGIAMKKLGYTLYGGKVYKKCDKAKYTYSYKCEVEAYVNGLAANELFKARLLKDILANPFCEVIRPLRVDYNLTEVNDGRCWSIKERRFLHDVIIDKDIGHVTPKAFSTYDATKEVEPTYFKEILDELSDIKFSVRQRKRIDQIDKLPPAGSQNIVKYF